MSEPTLYFCIGIEQDHTEGSVQTTCRRCGAAIWLAPSGQELFAKEPDTIPVCLSHLRQMLDDGTVPPDAPVKAVGPEGKIVSVDKNLMPEELNDDWKRPWILGRNKQ